MLRRILIAIDGSNNALQAVAYVGKLYGGTRDVEFTLLYIQPPVPPIYREEGHDPQVRKQFSAWKAKREDEARRYTEQASETLKKAGLDAAQIQKKYRPQAVGVARDIVWEADAEGYDAIVVGKKGRSWLEELFVGSITHKLVELSSNHPLWVVSGDEDPQKVLVALDETDNAMQLVNYAGTMFKELEGINIHLYHWYSRFSEGLTDEEVEALGRIGKRYAEHKREKMSERFQEAKGILTESGIRESAIEFHFDDSVGEKKISKGILAKTKKEKFGTLIMGRKGSSQAREFSLGSVCQRILGEAENFALWIVA